MAENKDEGPTCSVPKKRKPNWTTDECLYLSKLVDENKSVLRSKFGAGVTTVKKRETWGKITDAINATSSTKRSVEEVEKKWHNIQMRGKAEICRRKTQCQKKQVTKLLYCIMRGSRWGDPPPLQNSYSKINKIMTYEFILK